MGSLKWAPPSFGIEMPRNTTRQLGLPGFDLQDYVNESIAFLREHEPPEGYYLGFSGGKDSITTHALCRMAGVKFQGYYCCTRIDPPEIYAFIKRHYPDVIWLFPKTSFWSMVKQKHPPFRMIRWCCTELKKNPSRAIPLNFRLMGIRAEESVARAKYPRIDVYSKLKSQILLKPIFHWPEWAVWDFIEAEGLAYPCLYDEGWSRIGCVVCPFIMGDSPNKVAEKKRSMARWPGIWRVYKHVFTEWFEAKFGNGLWKNQKFKTAGEFWRAYLNGGRLNEGGEND